MTKRELKSQPTWTDVKAKLAVFDRTALLDLLHHLYAAHKDNQAFLHAWGSRIAIPTPISLTVVLSVVAWLPPLRSSSKGICALVRDLRDLWVSVLD
jgi:hypothetical protein